MAAVLLGRAVAFRRALGTWFAASQRRLPWRAPRSVYRTVVSEFMLQQTQVETATPYFLSWVRRWPDFGALAGASPEEVLREWAGLGYYNRARNLHRLAGIVSALPALPRTVGEWERLPGVGPYTAAAIASIACGERVAVVDGNVVRVLARLVADGREFRSNGDAVTAFAALAQALVGGDDPGAHNEAMMELGAVCCRRQGARCGACPVASFCAARAGGLAGRLPRFAPRVVEQVVVRRLWLVRAGRLLLCRYAEGARRLSGLHELPLAQGLVADADGELAVLVARKRRSISQQRIVEEIVSMRWSAALGSRIAGRTDLQWVPLGELDAVALSGPHRRWVRELAGSFLALTTEAQGAFSGGVQ